MATVQKSRQATAFGLRKEQKQELADAHTHLDLITDINLIERSIDLGVGTIITCGADMETSIKALALSDNNFIFAEVGIDPQFVVSRPEDIDRVCDLARKNRSRIVGIGEIGLDYKIAVSQEDRKTQIDAFRKMVELGIELGKPLSVHSRNSMEDIIDILQSADARNVQLHYFEGDENDAKKAADLGYFISVPPLESNRRARAIKNFPIEMLMAETDSPVIGKAPYDVEISVKFVAKSKGLGYDEAAIALTRNTKGFFRINSYKS